MAYKKLKFWFDKELAQMLGEKLKALKADFDLHQFVSGVDKKVEGLELKDRVEVITDELHTGLGLGYKKNLSYLLQILGPENQEETGMFTNFYWVMPVAKYVEKYGLDELELSMKAMEEITKRNTSEYCIRPFIEKYPEKTIARMLTWTTNDNFHIRRLASEGGRPRLPWASKLQAFIDDPSPLLPILDKLKDDPSKYVQKSVANCLNDILKDNVDLGKEFIESWLPATSKERTWIIKHAVRNLRKAGDGWALLHS